VSDVLLVLDFPGRREEARATDLRLEEAGWKVGYLLSAPFSRATDAPGYAADLAGRHRGDAPRAILAYCMAAPLAQELAARLSPPGRPVPLLLFDGEPADAAAILSAVRTVAGQLAPQSDVEDGIAALFGDDALATGPAESMAAIAAYITGLAAGVFRADGFDDREAAAAAADVSAFYLDWLTHLVAALSCTWPRWGGRVDHIRTPAHTGPAAWPGAGRTENHVVRTGRNGLLSDPRTRELALALLGPAT
jgi:hypothetical protein